MIPTETATHKQYTHSQFETNTVQLKTRQKQTPGICSSSQDQCPSAGRVSGEALRDDVELFLPVIDRVCSEHHMTELCKPPLAAQPRAAGGAQHPMALTCCPCQPFFFFPTLYPIFHLSPYRSVRAHTDICTSQGGEQTLLRALPELTPIWSCTGPTRVRQIVFQDII